MSTPALARPSAGHNPYCGIGAQSPSVGKRTAVDGGAMPAASTITSAIPLVDVRIPRGA
jgi:hypothetical protein